MLWYVVVDVQVDRHTQHGLELILELGDVEQGNLASHCWRDGGEQIEVTPFVIIASSGRAKKFGLNEAIGLDQAPDVRFLSSYRVIGPLAFLPVDAKPRAKCRFCTLLRGAGSSRPFVNGLSQRARPRRATDNR